MKIRRLVFRSRTGGSGAVSGRFSAGGGFVEVAGRRRLNRIGSFSLDRSALDVDENELVRDDVDDEIVGWLSSDWLNDENVGAERS